MIQRDPLQEFLRAVDAALDAVLGSGDGRGLTGPVAPVDHYRTDLASLGGLSVRRRDILHSYEPAHPAAILVLEGRKSIFAGERLRHHAAGTLMLFPAGRPVTVINEPDAASGRYRAVWLECRPRLLERFAAAYPEPVRHAVAAGPTRGSSHITVPLEPAVAQAFPHALRAAAGRPPLPTAVAEHRLMELLLAFDGPALAAVFSPRLGDVAARVRAMVRLEPSAAWTAEDVARRLGMSVPTLNRRLRDQDVSFRRVVEDERMMLAAALLHEGGIAVAGVAQRCGYASPSRFAHRFKARFGLAPSQALAAVIAPA